ncbi:MAG: peptidylprolyl isomerase [Acidimicrobiia bacterium]|nr:peptidylprolyl isomerase [Acidimicrobiia bacterium]MDH4308405.1 peptidylprolyl isomerase [Acidimicrobiia bacterium]MDH5293313.1 peptidylprolyl isomerase [Acidimicrobiia bacterium]MDH5519856.1 peptidylprolyl isomerase [Acidimicrobiia bacterium]
MANERRQRQKELEQAKRAAAKKAASRKELWRRLRAAFAMGGLVVALLLLINYLGADDESQPERYLDYRAQPTACGAEQPVEQTMERWTESADQAIDTGSSVSAVIATSCGDIVIELDPATAPASVNDFVFLARQGAYDGTVVSHVDPALRIEAGDPEADGTGTHFMDGRRRSGYRTPDEFPDEGFEMTRGVVAFAGDRSSRGSGFFIVMADATPLSNRFNVFGTVTEGLDVLDAIAAVPRKAPPGSGARTAPSETIYIESVTVG